MRLRKLPAALALALCGVLALTAIASAGKPAKTKVTIQAESGGFFGFVSSPKTQKCANGRKVVLYKQKGNKQKPSKDTKIGSDTAQPNGDGIMWNTGNTGSHSGRFYARAPKKPGCKPDSSRTVHAQA